MNTLLNAALEWCKTHPVIPIKPRDKIPLTTHGLKDCSQLQSNIREWWRRWPAANIGIVCNGLLVLDFDVKEGGLSDGKPAMIAKYGELPTTRVHRTGGGGEHWLYKVPTDLNIRPGAKKYGFAGLDIRANDSYILVPPSVTSGQYEIIDSSPVAMAPAWLIELSKIPTPTKVTTTKTGGEVIPEGQRNVTLTSLAGSMRRRGATQTAIEAALLETNKQCEVPLSDNEVLAIAGSVSRYEPAIPGNNGHNKVIQPPQVFNANSAPERKDVPHLFEVEGRGKIIPEGQHTTIFSQGGSGKSITGCDYLTLLYSNGITDGIFTPLGQGPVLVCDWETELETHRRYITAIKRELQGRENAELDAGIIHYMKFAEPITIHANFIRDFIKENSIELVIIDSQMAAMAGAFNSIRDEQLGGIYYNILSAWGITTLTIDHVPKSIMNSDSGAGAAFGSVVKYNRARSVFELKQAQEPGENVIELAFVHQKNNLGPKLKPFGIRIEFQNDQDGDLERVIYSQFDLSESTKLERLRPLWERMKDAILWTFNGSASVKQLAAELDTTEGNIRACANRYINVFTKVGGDNRDGALWGILQQA